ncbi:MAG: hypothetical protein CM1200mP2_18220 [Planctomycetaceae bacterium]|nr:MAG: hypothetical protein CM1200mP2_18220 [Planctomycetaceae bacterium]
MATTSRGGQAQYVEFDEFVDSKLVGPNGNPAHRHHGGDCGLSAVVLSYLCCSSLRTTGWAWISSVHRPHRIGLSIVLAHRLGCLADGLLTPQINRLLWAPE